jgi:hypothetical protein
LARWMLLMGREARARRLSRTHCIAKCTLRLQRNGIIRPEGDLHILETVIEHVIKKRNEQRLVQPASKTNLPNIHV